jgi:uncharacterized damage-inducible protein DinB
MTTAVLEAPTESVTGRNAGARTVETLARNLAGVLRQTAEVVASLPEDAYAAAVHGQTSGAIGGHVRHCLDHVSALLLGLETTEIDYDKRERGTLVETDRHRAFERIHELERRLLSEAGTRLDQLVTVRAMVNATDSTVRLRSSVGREFVFVLSHTIHHNAMIAAAARTHGISLPKDFGFAPSTIAHWSRQACAPSLCFG